MNLCYGRNSIQHTQLFYIMLNQSVVTDKVQKNTLFVRWFNSRLILKTRQQGMVDLTVVFSTYQDQNFFCV